eukprot:7062571-Ditylum_brightwellii.AAC.1
MNSYMDEMNEREVDIWGWAEANVNWTKNLLARAKYYGNTIFNFFTLVGTSSDDPQNFINKAACVWG